MGKEILSDYETIRGFFTGTSNGRPEAGGIAIIFTRGMGAFIRTYGTHIKKGGEPAEKAASPYNRGNLSPELVVLLANLYWR